MLTIIKNLLEKTIKDIDAGNSYIDEKDATKIIETIRDISDSKLSKYQAFTYLGIGRSKFDELVRDGKLPKGIKQQGFKELFWYKRDLNKYLARVR